MNNSYLLTVYKIVFFCLFFFWFSLGSIAQTVVNNTADPRHETLNQRVISVLINSNITSATTAGWSVTVNGTAVIVNSVAFVGDRVLVTFDASPVHAGEPYVKPGEVLRVSYNATTGNTQTVLGEIVTFTNVQSKNNYGNPSFPPAAAVCSELVFFNLTDYGTVDICAPVTMNFRQFAYKLSLRMRNSSQYTLSPILYSVNWGDGTPAATITPVFSDLTSNPSPGFISGTDPAFANKPAVILTARPTKNYPATTTPAPDRCSWDARVTPFFSGLGVGVCTPIAAATTFASYDTDNANTGALNMPFNPPGAGETTDRVCLGTNVNMRFTDLTQLNCRLAVESGVPNQLVRYIRIVYGSQNNAINIPDIRVGGVPVTSNNAAGTHLFPANPLIGGGPGYVPTGIGGIGVPDANGVIELATPVTVSTATTFMRYITTVSANNQAVGDRFYVMLQYWDVCNPYKDPLGIGPTPFTAPVTIDNYVEIITKPAPLTTAGLTLCYSNTNSTAFNFTATGGVAGRTAVNWYRNLASVGTATRMTNPNGNNSLNFPASAYGAQGG
ncbi:MAG TPA: hypothetical protein PKC10_03540, partial [Cyclobacteriaceae bacterium]|nr:hypothetical protein [Cyclobacteriaceae bacterium]